VINEKDILTSLEKVNYPGFSRNIISFGLVKSVGVDGNDVEVKIEIATKDPSIPQKIHNDSQEAISAISGVGNIKVDIDVKDPPEQVGENGLGQASLPGVKKIIAVASGKGGVGKSTVAANLAIALSLSKNNPNVGLCDCDLYGPSIPLMFGKEDARPMATDENEIIPIESHGLKLMSMGFLLDDNSPVIVRGPLATRYTQQFLQNCQWGELDYLVLDLPPGTGDIQLTIAQSVAVDGAIIVTTPQEMALIDARKAASMFAKVNVPILGIIENMSYFLCPSDGEKYAIFGEGGGEKESSRLGVPLIGKIPIEMQTREAGDSGNPVALGDSKTSKEFNSVAENVISAVS
jgi:ATP-binding protein involved in chromosome partitioning